MNGRHYTFQAYMENGAGPVVLRTAKAEGVSVDGARAVLRELLRTNPQYAYAHAVLHKRKDSKGLSIACEFQKPKVQP